MKRSKTSAGKTKRPYQMTKEELISTLVKKKQCNAKALSIVELMLERDVNPQWLVDSLQFIHQSHYQDVVEERAITKICGYPLCKNPLGKVPKQQFHISTQNNKVYDISERKNFCSNACYRSSSYLKDQILTSPLWLRDIDKPPEFKLLDGGSSRGGIGDEVDVGLTRVSAQEVHNTSSENESLSQKQGENRGQSNENKESSCSTFVNDDPEISSVPVQNLNKEYISSQDDLVENISACTSTSSFETTPQELRAALPSLDTNASKLSDNCVREDLSSINVLRARIEAGGADGKKDKTVRDIGSDSNPSKSSAVVADGTKEEGSNLGGSENSKNVKERMNKAKAGKDKRSSRHSKATPGALPCVSEMVEERLIEWGTIDTLCFLFGEQRLREMLTQQGGDLLKDFKPLNLATWDPEKHDRFVKICKRLNLLDLEDRSYDEKVINEDKNVVKKPLPDYSKLKEEAEKMDLRVKAFYKGQFEIEPRKVTFAENTKEGAGVDESPVLPLVHQHEQRALRRRLVLDALNRVLPDLLRTIGMHSSHVNSSLRGLVGTFALTAGNITFNPRQWTLVAIAIIKLLSVKEAQLQYALASEASQKYLTLIQMSYNLSPTYLDLLIDRMVSSVLSKPAEIS